MRPSRPRPSAASPSPMRSRSAKGTLRASEMRTTPPPRRRSPPGEVQTPTREGDGEPRRAVRGTRSARPPRSAADRARRRTTRLSSPERQPRRGSPSPTPDGCGRYSRGRANGQQDQGAEVAEPGVTDPGGPDHRDKGGRQGAPELDRDDSGENERRRLSRSPRRHHGWRLYVRPCEGTAAVDTRFAPNVCVVGSSPSHKSPKWRDRSSR